jgi:hypothetical protein
MKTRAGSWRVAAASVIGRTRADTQSRPGTIFIFASNQ